LPQAAGRNRLQFVSCPRRGALTHRYGRLRAQGITWTEFDHRLRQQGLVAGGSYGSIAGKVFRLGHMGTQADMGLVKQALDILDKELYKRASK